MRSKGVIDIEFIVSALVFLTTIIFVTFLIISEIPTFRSGAFSDDLRSRAYETSQLLLFDEGEPANWQTLSDVNQVRRLGLSSGSRYGTSSSKISKLNEFCSTISGYQSVKGLLGLDFRNDVRINVTDASGALASCGPGVTGLVRPQAQITRFGVLSNNNVMAMTVSIL